MWCIERLVLLGYLWHGRWCERLLEGVCLRKGRVWLPKSSCPVGEQRLSDRLCLLVVRLLL